MALPTMTRTIDDDFLETWYEIREEAIDNILSATVMWLALREFNCLVDQTGGEYITRPLRYGTKTKQNIAKGTTLQQSVTKRETMAWWDWGYTAIDMNRSLIDDQKNSGPSKIKDYVTKRISGARDDLVQDFETDLFLWAAYAANQPNGLFDIVAPETAIAVDGNHPGAVNAAAISPTNDEGTFGNVSKATNTWWRPKYKDGEDLGYQTTLKSDMTTFYNTISANMAPPNFIITDQVIYEYYEEEASDRLQIARTSFNREAADLGFDSITFKGIPVTWTGKLAGTLKMLFLNMDFIELVYDPNYWFDMTEWMTTPSQLERVSYVVNAFQLITSQLRRHGMLDYNTATD